MWHDVETTKDFLNFNIIAETAAELVRESGKQPLSIGISGGWGTGKSSLVKMIGKCIADQDDDSKNYILLEFNAWLYQGYDDARMALLQTVADRLYKEAEKRKTHVDKAKEFLKRVNWLRVGKLLAPSIAGAVVGGTLAGPLGAVIGAVGGLCKAGGSPSQEDLDKLKSAYKELQPEITGLLKEKESKSLPQEIEALRNTFADLLESLNVKLIVLVDDLDRCLPLTAISTLEAMRLLLFMPRTTFIIAADEQMIRGAVRSHFGDVDLGDDLVTSYFDKLIQVPLQVPRLGRTEIKAYIILLLADRLMRKGNLSKEAFANAENKILCATRNSWTEELSRKNLEEAFGDDATKVNTEIDIADQLADIMVTADQIAGNPRLIKRFLNNLIIKEAIAKAEKMTIPFDQLVKLQLFERCASPAAFEFLVKHVTESKDGIVQFLGDIEERLEKGEDWEALDPSWKDVFIEKWVKLNPKLGETDLGPLLHLSRHRSLSLASFDELSPDGRELLNALLVADAIMPQLVEKLKPLGEIEAESILNRLRRRARSSQWDFKTLRQALHVPKAFPKLGQEYIKILNDIPPEKRPAAIIPSLKNVTWAEDILKRWTNDERTPKEVKNSIAIKVEDQ
jgi:predicted KAP-like P-loop ATPase